jgi:hypothetical protein
MFAVHVATSTEYDCPEALAACICSTIERHVSAVFFGILPSEMTVRLSPFESTILQAFLFCRLISCKLPIVSQPFRDSSLLMNDYTPIA